MNLQDLIDDPPLVHRGGEVVWGLAPVALNFIWETVEPGWNTIETGLGISTATFGLKETNHVCIVPSVDEVNRLKSYCAKKAISLGQMKFITEGSERVVHSIATTELDFVLIDGGHGFPTPFIDWFYLANRMRVGGLVMVDDTQLWTGHVLKQYLQSEAGWGCEKVFPRTAVFRMVSPFAYSNWTDQPYVKRKSFWLIQQTRLKAGARMLGEGEFSKLWKLIKKELRREGLLK